MSSPCLETVYPGQTFSMLYAYLKARLKFKFCLVVHEGMCLMLKKKKKKAITPEHVTGSWLDQ